MKYLQRWRARNAWRAFVNRCVPVSRARLLAAQSAAENFRRARDAKNELVVSLQAEKDAAWAPLLERAAKVDFVRSRAEHRNRDVYRVSVTIAPEIMWGTDDHTRDYMCEHIARQIGRELRTARFVEPEREGYPGYAP